MPKPIDAKKVTNVQRKYLTDRVDNHYYHNRREVNAPKAPPEVKAAEAVMPKWNNGQRRRRARSDARFAAGRKAAKDAVLFGTPAEALAAVRVFEGLQP